MQLRANEPLRIFLRAIGRQVRRHVPDDVPAPGQDVHQVHRHASGERRSQRLDRRRTSASGAIEHERRFQRE